MYKWAASLHEFQAKIEKKMKASQIEKKNRDIAQEEFVAEKEHVHVMNTDE